MRSVTTVIIGAGQAGLAMSQALTRRSIDHLILEKGSVGNAWRKERWDSLRLLTPNWANGLPGAPYRGADPDGFMPVSQFAGQLDAYAEAIHAPIRCNTAVRRVTAASAGYRVETDCGALSCKSLVLATGACARPRVPAVAAAVPRQVHQITPATYKRADDLPQGRVLVVGASASGVQLAREIQSSGRAVTLAVGQHLRLPRRYRGRDIERWLDLIGVMDQRYDMVEDLTRARRAPSPQLIGSARPVDLNALQEAGVEVVGRLADIRDGRALFSGGLGAHTASADLKLTRLLDEIDAWAIDRGVEAELPPPDRPEPTRLPASPRLWLNLAEIDTVLWATGYAPDFSWLDLPVFDARGQLRHDGGVVAAPGVYALGLPLMRRRRSHQISGVGSDARDLANHLTQHLDAARAA